jgi:N-acetylneuraminic acid mutarotase
MKKQTTHRTNAYFIRGAFYLLLLIGVCAIPFALGQRSPLKLRVAEPAAAPPSTLNPALMPWTVVADYPETVESPAVASDGSYAYSAGGTVSFVSTDGFYRYDPVADMWTVLTALPQHLFAARAVYAANVHKIYVFGGLDEFLTVFDTTYIYDIASDSWTSGDPMPDGRYFPNVAYSSNGKIYVIGGFDTFFSEASQTWEYDPFLDTWNIVKTGIPVPMAGSATSIVGQSIYLAGS